MSVQFRWQDCKMNALGDSLTKGDISGKGLQGIPWTGHMKDLTGLYECRNYGINGNKLALEKGMAERYVEMDNDADVISVFGGMNDFCKGVPLGTVSDNDVSTFFGAINVMINGLYKKFPRAEIFFITPPKCKSSFYGWESFTPNTSGHILKDYRDAILTAADIYSIPVLDLYSCSGMSCYLDDGTFRPDGLHFSNAGHERLAHKIAAFMNTL
ncbi:MAG: SGNH/GDSL hydrolase family protein [Bacillota bacterium]|nr:SGNH/GDSL hydrolase family protein [Bacillota bacterium]